MKKALVCAMGLLVAGTARAQEVKFTPNLDIRLRWEHFEQDGMPEDADAVTLRVRPGVAASWRNWTALVDLDAVVALTNSYNDGFNGKTRYPLVPDAENLELNRAQLRYAGKDGLAITAGRQRLNFADDRFVGNAPWRQSERTYDSVRFQYGKPLGLSTDVAYSWSVRTTDGRQGRGSRPQAIGGDNVFALVNYGTKIGTLSGFAYLVDQDEAAVQGFRLSTQTYGARFTGSQPLGKGVSLGYAASWARQSNYHRNPNRYAAAYWMGEAKLTAGGLSLIAGHEVLGADKGVALTSVQTPLAPLFKFNGWAGKFGTTPPNGLRDLYGNVGYAWKKVGPLDAINIGAIYHRFRSDRLDQRYGDEFDFIAGMKHGRYALSARYGRYKAKQFATDTNKLFVQLDWIL